MFQSQHLSIFFTLKQWWQHFQKSNKCLFHKFTTSETQSLTAEDNTLALCHVTQIYCILALSAQLLLMP